MDFVKSSFRDAPNQTNAIVVILEPKFCGETRRAATILNLWSIVSIGIIRKRNESPCTSDPHAEEELPEIELIESMAAKRLVLFTL